MQQPPDRKIKKHCTIICLHFRKSNHLLSMGGGTMHVGHLLPQLRNTLNNFPSSSSPSNLNPSLSTDKNNGNTKTTLSCCCCHHSQLCRKLELLDGRQEKIESGSLYNHVFEHVPSQREVEDAISALQE